MLTNIFQWRPITVTAGAEEATDAYCTLAELRADPALKLAVGETTDDALLQDLIDAVKQMIDTHTGRTFACSTDTTRHFDMWDVWGNSLHVKDDLCAITTITNGDADEIETGEYATVPRDLLAVTNANYVPYWKITIKGSSGKSWTYTDDPEGAIAVTGKWAWSVTAPDDIRQANIIGAAAMYRLAATADIERPIVAGGGIVISPAQMPSRFYALLERYVRKV